MRSRFAFAAAVAGALFIARPAQAQSVFFDNYCAAGFTTCASVRVYASGNSLTMQLWNLQDNADALASIGLYNLGASDDWAGTIQSFDASVIYGDGTQEVVTDDWRVSTSGNGLGAESVDQPVSASAAGTTATGCRVAGCQGIASTYGINPILVFRFILSNPFQFTSNLAFLWTFYTSGGSCTTGLLSGCGGVSVTPEPVTVALLGTGLLGIGGVGFIRRRRDKTIS